MSFRSIALALLSAQAALAHADGVVIFDLAGNTSDLPAALALGADGRLYVAASARPFDHPDVIPQGRLVAFDAAGNRVATFGVDGNVPETLPAAALEGRLDGAVLRSGGFTLSVWSPAGTSLARVTLPRSDFGVGEVGMSAAALHVQQDGRALVGGTIGDQWALARLDSDASLDATFAQGAGWVRRDAGVSRSISALHPLAAGRFLAIGAASQGGGAVLGRFEADGTPDFGFGGGSGTNGLITLGACNPFCLRPRVLVDSAGRIYVGGGATVVRRLDPNGAPDGSYASVAVDPSMRYIDMALDSADRVIVFASRGNQASVMRFLTTGAADSAFGTGGEALVGVGAGAPPQEALIAGRVQADDKPVALLAVAGEWDGAESLSNGPTDLAIVRFTDSGAFDTSFGANHVDADVYPDAFIFQANTAPFGTAAVVSNAITISGITSATSVRIAGTAVNAAVSLGCSGLFLPGGAVTALPGETICVRHSASAQPGGSAKTILDVGGRRGPYVTVSTADAADTVPDAFAFADQTGVAPDTTITSNTLAIAGVTGFAPVAVTGGQYSIGCNAQNFTSNNSVITNGESVCVRHEASGQAGATVNTTLAIGGVTDIFSSTTMPPAPAPNPSVNPPPSSGSGGGGASSPFELAVWSVLLWGALRRRAQTTA